MSTRAAIEDNPKRRSRRRNLARRKNASAGTVVAVVVTAAVASVGGYFLWRRLGPQLVGKSSGQRGIYTWEIGITDPNDTCGLTYWEVERDGRYMDSGCARDAAEAWGLVRSLLPDRGAPDYPYWVSRASDGYWDAWIQRPDGQRFKANDGFTYATDADALNGAAIKIESYGGNPVKSLGAP